MRYSRRVRTLCLGGLGLATALAASSTTSAWAASPEGRPVAVSPGDATKVALIRDDCPTFSWGEVEGAKSYDLVVYRLGEQDEHKEPVLRRSFPGSVDGWTPALDQCLDRGGRYAWSVRALGDKEAWEWSELSLFQVASGPSEEEFEEAVEVVRQYLKQEDTGHTISGSSSASAPVTAVPPTAGIVGPTPLSLVGAGDADLQVNGSPVLTEATLGASCLGRRWLDQGDGTVLDCNTRRIWLKDASCGALAFTDAEGRADWDDAQLAAAALSSGVCDLTDGSAASDWRVPTVLEMRSGRDLDNSSFENCAVAAYATSLLDNRFGFSPGLSNSAGDGQWVPGDPFVGVQIDEAYWTSTEDAQAPLDNAWFMNTFGQTNNLLKTFGLFVWPVRDPS